MKNVKQYLDKMEKKFTVAEIKKYILSKDSMGDILYYLSAENTEKANEPEETYDDEDGDDN
jgi:hypothetical protein